MEHVARFGDRVELRRRVAEDVVEADAEEQIVLPPVQQRMEGFRRFEQFPIPGFPVEFDQSVETGEHLIYLRPLLRFRIPLVHRAAGEGIGDQVRREVVGALPVGGDLPCEIEKLRVPGGAIKQHHRLQNRTARNSGKSAGRTEPDLVLLQRMDKVHGQPFGPREDFRFL